MAQETTQKIGVATATIIGMNAMIGSGIFSAPAIMAANVGPAGILAYIFVVIAVWFMVLSLARLAALFPQEGSFYTYAKQWGGHTAGLIANSFYLIGLVIAMGLLCQMAGFYLQPFFPNTSALLLGGVALAGLVILNMMGVALSEMGQHILIVLTTFPILGSIVLCLLHANSANLTPFAPYGLGNVMKATREVIFGFFGFESATSLFNIVRNPERNVPKAVTYSIVIVGVLYTLFIASLILAVPLNLFSFNTPLPETFRILFPEKTWFLFALQISILSAILGTVHSMIWGSSALLVSFSKKINHSLALSHRASVAIIGLGIFLTFMFLKNIGLFFSLTAAFIVSAYMLSMISLFTLGSEWKSGRNVITVIGFITAGFILFFACEGIVLQLTSHV